jgi:hypothetical protein
MQEVTLVLKFGVIFWYFSGITERNGVKSENIFPNFKIGTLRYAAWLETQADRFTYARMLFLPLTVVLVFTGYNFVTV